MKNVNSLLLKIKALTGVLLDAFNFGGINYDDDFVFMFLKALQYKKSHENGVDKKMPQSFTLNEDSLIEGLSEIKKIRSLRLNKTELKHLLGILREFTDKYLILNLIPYYTSHYLMNHSMLILLNKISSLSLNKECFIIGMDKYDDCKDGADMIRIYFDYILAVSMTRFSFVNDDEFRQNVLDLYLSIGEVDISKYLLLIEG